MSLLQINLVGSAALPLFFLSCALAVHRACWRSGRYSESYFVICNILSLLLGCCWLENIICSFSHHNLRNCCAAQQCAHCSLRRTIGKAKRLWRFGRLLATCDLWPKNKSFEKWLLLKLKQWGCCQFPFFKSDKRFNIFLFFFCNALEINCLLMKRKSLFPLC